jgi:hypothetical protein
MRRTKSPRGSELKITARFALPRFWGCAAGWYIALLGPPRCFTFCFFPTQVWVYLCQSASGVNIVALRSGTVVVALQAKNIDNGRSTKSITVLRQPRRATQGCHCVPYASAVFPQRQQYERLLSNLPSAGHRLLQQRRGLPV